MDPQLTRKDFVNALISVLSLAIDRERLDDGDALLAALRTLRPKMRELDTFEAWLAMKRHAWAEAKLILSSLEATLPAFDTARAFLAMCQYMTGDPAWRATATDVLEHSTDAGATDIARGLLDPQTLEDAASADTAPAAATFDPMRYTYALRA